MRGVRTVKIDAFPESTYRCLDHDAIVCVDVLLAATTAVTCLARGRKVFFASSHQEARAKARTLVDPILAQEAPRPAVRGFEPQAGPAALDRRADVRRPLVLVSSLTHLLANAEVAPAVYVACLRNMAATARQLCEHHERVALLGAGYAGELRCEDQMAAAWMGRTLLRHGFEPEDLSTSEEIERWEEADASVVALGKAADYLRRLGQKHDLDFVLRNVDDLDLLCRYRQGEVHVAGPARRRVATAVSAAADPVALLGRAPVSAAN